jgi:microsomal dipeptidase-like Zn-dependent dipeptidase/GMP synthase-like glutamine amidotransferase
MKNSMADYSIDSLTAEAYKHFPETARKPIIGLTANHSDIDATIREAYYHQIVKAGGVPMIIPPVADTSVVINTLAHLDALILTGGGDYDPRWCNEEPSPFLHTINAVRDPAELMITRLAYNRQIPMLGICRGMQTLAMALDGHVAQDIAEQQTTICHDQKEDRPIATHDVTLSDDSILYSLYSSKIIKVNTFHHQAVDNPGKRFRCVATADDGVIEAMESTEQKSIIGVQWHPEWLGNDGLPIFKWLITQANEYRAACDLHDRVLTLDTHCDTPMFFHQGVNFLERDPRILVDLHKMTEGHLDATFMVCYLPQPKDGKSFDEMVHFDIASPTAYTDFIFDKIEAFAKEKPEYLAIARSSADLYANKAQGKKSIVLGIENGLALDGKLENVKHFADRGVAYITLCHNGDNDICDSARGTQTHGGVSAFGEKVIHEMNRQGIMVDLSHAAETSFYDAIEISQTPIVCSHSNCRALCDHPRNLTDDQLRAMARCGGVAHTTFYPGFLNKAGEADILDAVKHLEHAIDIMGIDHVGIGTDFDGDGGVPGMANASEIINFTRQLLRRRYSETDIKKIWGGNWLRIMDMAKAAKA